MRLVSLLLLSVLLSVFVGVAVPFSSASGEECGSCCAGERGNEEKDDPSAPCNTAECPCGFCLPAVLPGTITIPSLESPANSSSYFCSALLLKAFPDGIDYPPERISP